MKRFFTVAALVISIVLLQGAGLAEDVIILPDEIAFEDVEVGLKKAQALVIAHKANTEVEAAITLTGTCPDFSLGETPNPLVIPSSANASTVILYAPSRPGLCSGTIRMRFTWITPFKRIDLGTRTVSVTGNGVAPGEKALNMRSILRFFDASVTAKSLQGTGRGRGDSPVRRLEALRGLLEEADNQIRKGDVEEACNILNGVSRKIDGRGRPDSAPDFASGDALPELADMVDRVMADFGCP